MDTSYKYLCHILWQQSLHESLSWFSCTLQFIQFSLNWTHILQWNVFGIHSDGLSPLLNSFVRVKSLSMSKLVMCKGVQTKKSGWCRVRLFTALYFFVIFIRSLNTRIKDGIARELDASAKWCSRLFLLANPTPTYPRVLRVRFAWIFFCVHFARIFFRVR